ncbi:HAD-IIIA family hydrolase [Pseudomonas matsuisoli]|uniref:Hydrolase n=1 Tax=Pseudomonas matsuisoli TaxID=1515666 RepID=A0A917PT57_9PSED|nr:hydrolase [Pseudomonas matsuisoli]
MRDFDLLIFDWDGTLCDSISRIVTSMQEAALDCGVVPQSSDAIKSIIGLSLHEAIRILHPELRPDISVEAFGEAYSARYVAADAVPSRLFEGVPSALKRFADSGYQLAVATGKSRRGLNRMLRQHGLDDFFDITRCADETAGKPDPQMLYEILEHCCVSASRALMVGDALFDLRMASNAGMRSAAASYGAMSRDLLAAARPHMIFDRFQELESLLLREPQSIGMNEYV